MAARPAFVLTAPSMPVFAIAVALALAALIAHFGGVAIPWVSGHVVETLTAAFALLTAGVVLRGL
ncbi:hypothetical protein QO010_004597 [Caulobacter ginsengisoli]|uniref:Uncharacterized protein n=1 Tax=Caulobacter ginsengisoli TaxID=400775 RepID=A0ABU0IZS5_9CAUL|nr:hypothetical protein [Caulobacter ginsengisoli]MDQ0466801.1 hypothetical protein [Caulobacter ginsengisoli]